MTKHGESTSLDNCLAYDENEIWHLLDHWKEQNYTQDVLKNKFDPYIRIYCEGEPKPTLRGMLHYIPLVAFGACIYPLLTMCQTYLHSLVVFGFCAMNIFTFTCSVILHTWHLNPVQEIFIQKCDHAGVFLNTAMHTTQYIILGLRGRAWSELLLILTWLTAIWGITLIILKKKRNHHTAFCPLGLVISLPFLKAAFSPEQFTYLVVTWSAITLGLIFYVAKKPSGWPQVFGYHEFFHLLTVIATFTSIRLEMTLLESIPSTFV